MENTRTDLFFGERVLVASPDRRAIWQHAVFLNTTNGGAPYLAIRQGDDQPLEWSWCIPLKSNEHKVGQFVWGNPDALLLVPFQKVLVRDSIDDTWIPAFFGRVQSTTNEIYETVGGLLWRFCIPYDGNEKLIYTHNPQEVDDGYQQV